MGRSGKVRETFTGRGLGGVIGTKAFSKAAATSVLDATRASQAPCRIMFSRVRTGIMITLTKCPKKSSR